ADLAPNAALGSRDIVGRCLLAVEKLPLLGARGRGEDGEQQEGAGELHARRPPEASRGSSACPARLRRRLTIPAKASAATSTACARRVWTVGKRPSTGMRGAPATGVRPMSPASCSSKTPRPAKTIAIR